jgi:hypothetical protein
MLRMSCPQIDILLHDSFYSHIRRLAGEFNSPMPIIDVAHQHLITTRAIHQGQKQEGRAKYEILDTSGIIAGTRVAAGLDGLDSLKVVWNCFSLSGEQ